MAPGVTTEIPVIDKVVEKVTNGTTQSTSLKRQPLKKTGIIDEFKFLESTPSLGREYPTLNIADDILKAPNADELIRDMAITICERGVVFFRGQSNLTDEQQKEFIDRLGKMSGKPATNGLHIHPIFNPTSEFSEQKDEEISHINSAQLKMVLDQKKGEVAFNIPNSKWHTDIQFEKAPADFSSLRCVTIPSTGGDTLWASGYEMYDRFSPAYRKFLEGLTAKCLGEAHMRDATKLQANQAFYEGARGSPENVGKVMSADHPVVRTHPVTGWNSIFAAGLFPARINELYTLESQEVLAKTYNTIINNHDVQVRFKWNGPHDMAVWDNRCTFHSATYDYKGMGERYGTRAVGVAEVPYFDPAGRSRTEALSLAG